MVLPKRALGPFWGGALRPTSLVVTLALISTVGAQEAIQVLDPVGQPAANALVTFSDVDFVQQVRCDAQGKFTPPNVEWRDVTVSIDHPGAARFLWTHFGAEKPLRLTAAFSVEGKVQGADGTPIGGATVRVAAFGTNTYMLVHLRGDVAPQAISAEDGSFSLPGLTLGDLPFAPGARLSVQATLDGHVHAGGGGASYATPAMAKVLEELQEPLILTLEPTATVRGQVLDAISNEPMVGAQLSLNALSREGVQQVSDSEGRFEFKNVPTNTARFIHVRHPDLQRMTVYVHENEPAGVEPGHVDHLNLALRRAVRVSGTVLDEHSKQPALVPLTLSVRAVDTPAPGWTQRVGLEWSNVGNDARVKPDGTFAMWMPAGPITLGLSGALDANRKAYASEFSLTIAAEGQDPLSLELARKPGILFRMTLEPGPQPGNDVDWGRLVTSVNRVGENSYNYADDGPLWFYPVERWGHQLQVHVEDRSPTGAIELLPKTVFTADADSWPVELRLR